MLSKLQCLYVFIFLYGGTIFTLFFRALVRQRLLKDYADLKAENLTGNTTNRFLKILLTIPRQMQALRELGKSIAAAPDPVQRRYNRFQVLTWIATTLVVLLVIFSTVAHNICEPGRLG